MRFLPKFKLRSLLSLYDEEYLSKKSLQWGAGGHPKKLFNLFLLSCLESSEKCFGYGMMNSTFFSALTPPGYPVRRLAVVGGPLGVI